MARSSRSPRRSLTNFAFDMALRDMKSERRTNPFPKAPSVSCRVVTQAEADAAYEALIGLLQKALDEPESDEVLQ